MLISPTNSWLNTKKTRACVPWRILRFQRWTAKEEPQKETMTTQSETLKKDRSGVSPTGSRCEKHAKCSGSYALTPI